MLPIPAIVRTFPLIVPGPETTANVTERPDDALAESVTGPAPNATYASGEKVMV